MSLNFACFTMSDSKALQKIMQVMLAASESDQKILSETLGGLDGKIDWNTCQFPDCGKKTDLSVCQGCQLHKYCGRDHQVAHWQRHKPFCKIFLKAKQAKSAAQAAASLFQAHRSPNEPAAWATGLSDSDQLEWLSNCYQMRCDDDMCWGGGFQHGPYKLHTETGVLDLVLDFAQFCLLAKRVNAIPKDWNWAAFLKMAGPFIRFAFEKADARERWGGENYFHSRSLRKTGEVIYGSAVNNQNLSKAHVQIRDDMNACMEDAPLTSTLCLTQPGDQQDLFEGDMEAAASWAAGKERIFVYMDIVGGRKNWIALAQNLATLTDEANR